MAATGSGPVEFRLLGPIEVVRSGSLLRLGGPRQRTLLALLLVDAGRAVSVDRLIDELWDGRPPPGAKVTLPAYVTKLRAALGAAATITKGASGYTIEVPHDRVDVRRFERLAAEGREALARGAGRRAAERLQAALALWRGPPFAGLGDGGALRLEANRLEELRLLVLEARFEAELQLGAGDELVDELGALVQEHPYRERLWQHLMLALYRAQRQADALAAYQRARTILDEELGIEPSEELKALEQAILRHEVKAALPPKERHNLPAPVTSFVGRETELAEIERLLRETRLLTLSGVGGVGKTRLALEASWRALHDFPDGVFLVDFSALREHGLVPAHVSDAFDLRDQPDSTIDQLAAHVGDAELLLVLDNCEHLREAVAELVHGLLAACPRLRVLATSRESLAAPGETIYPVPPLGLPKLDAEPDELRTSEAVRLLLTRAKETRPQLRENAAAARSAARICRDLDGLPLAIELAAARATALSLDDISQRLSDRFRFLVSWRRLTTARHRTLREAMDWSYELLSEEEQALLAQLSVFAGGFTLAAVAAVCLDEKEERALELGERLLAASLVVVEESESEMRYRLLDTVREYARERLEASDVAVPTRDRHAAYFLALAEARSRDAIERGTHTLTGLDSDVANFRASLLHLRATGAASRELRLCAALWRWWWRRGEVAEGRQRLEAVLARAPAEATAAKVEALRGASNLALRQGAYATAVELAAQGVDAATRLGELPRARALVALANAVSSLGDLDRAEGLYIESAEGFRSSGRDWELANVLLNMADLALNRRDFEAAERLAGESLSLCRALGEHGGVAVNLGNIAFAALEQGQVERASEALVEALARACEDDFGEWIAIVLTGLAAVSCARRADRRAAELLGASQRLLEEVGASLGSIEGEVHARTFATLRDRLGDATLTEALASGRALSTADAVDLASSGGPQPLR